MGWGGAAALLARAAHRLSTRRIRSLALGGCLLALQPAALPASPARRRRTAAHYMPGLRRLVLGRHALQLLLPLLAPHCTRLEVLEVCTARSLQQGALAADRLVTGLRQSRGSGAYQREVLLLTHAAGVPCCAHMLPACRPRALCSLAACCPSCKSLFAILSSPTCVDSPCQCLLQGPCPRDLNAAEAQSIYIGR